VAWRLSFGGGNILVTQVEKEKKVYKVLKEMKKYWVLYVMLLPGAIYLFINNYIPMAGIIVAFKKYNVKQGIYGSPWCGLDNFVYLFKNDAWLIIRNTLGYNVLFIILNNIVAIAIAILINDVISEKAKKIYQSAIMLPFLISIVIVSYIVFAFLSVENGMINQSILAPLGQKPISWYSEPKYWPYILTFVSMWKGVGYGCLIYIASIVGIDKSFYEAAKLDGATKWQCIWKITLPLIVPAIITLLMLSIGRIFYSDFGLFYQVPQNSGALYSATNTIDTYVYRALTSAGGLGRSSAAGVFQSIVGFLLVMTSNALVRKTNRDSALF